MISSVENKIDAMLTTIKLLDCEISPNPGIYPDDKNRFDRGYIIFNIDKIYEIVFEYKDKKIKSVFLVEHIDFENGELKILIDVNSPSLKQIQDTIEILINKLKISI